MRPKFKSQSQIKIWDLDIKARNNYGDNFSCSYRICLISKGNYVVISKKRMVSVFRTEFVKKWRNYAMVKDIQGKIIKERE